MSDTTDALTDENSFFCELCGFRVRYVDALRDHMEHLDRLSRAVGLPMGATVGKAITFPNFKKIEAATKGKR